MAPELIPGNRRRVDAHGRGKPEGRGQKSRVDEGALVDAVRDEQEDGGVEEDGDNEELLLEAGRMGVDMDEVDFLGGERLEERLEDGGSLDEGSERFFGGVRGG